MSNDYDRKGVCEVSKSNKELAVDVALAYINASSVPYGPNNSKNTITVETVCRIISEVYKTLEKLDKND